jgi:hypothetical protein
MEPGLSSSLFRKRSPDSLRPDQTSIFSIPSPTRCRARSFDALRMTKKSERPPLPPLTCSNRDEVPHLYLSIGCRGHPWPLAREASIKRPRATTERGLNGGCRAQPCGAGVTPALLPTSSVFLPAPRSTKRAGSSGRNGSADASESRCTAVAAAASCIPGRSRPSPAQPRRPRAG